MAIQLRGPFAPEVFALLAAMTPANVDPTQPKIAAGLRNVWAALHPSLSQVGPGIAISTTSKIAAA